MPYIKPSQFEKALSQKFYPIILLAGDENYFLDSCLKTIEKKVSSDCLNRETFYVDEGGARPALEALKTIAFFNMGGERRLSIIKDLHEIKAADAEIISEYILEPMEDACLVLLYNAPLKNNKEIAARKNLLAKCAADENVLAVDCSKLKDYDRAIDEFIKAGFAKKGKSISAAGISKIKDDMGADILGISNEIEKISLFVLGEKTVGIDDIEAVSGRDREISGFALSNNIESGGDVKKSLVVLEKLLADGEAPPVIVSQIYQSIRKMLIAKSLMDEKNENPTSVLPPFCPPDVKRAFTSNLKNRSIESLMRALKEILEADLSVKTSQDSHCVLEKLILKIAL
jgi:DNA polymerase-3 subunit delta